MNCPECGWLLRERLRFCPNCGAEVPQSEHARHCPHCSAQIKGSVSVCPECGAGLTGEQPARVRPKSLPPSETAARVLARAARSKAPSMPEQQPPSMEAPDSAATVDQPAVTASVMTQKQPEGEQAQQPSVSRGRRKAASAASSATPVRGVSATEEAQPALVEPVVQPIMPPVTASILSSAPTKPQEVGDVQAVVPPLRDTVPTEPKVSAQVITAPRVQEWSRPRRIAPGPLTGALSERRRSRWLGAALGMVAVAAVAVGLVVGLGPKRLALGLGRAAPSEPTLAPTSTVASLPTSVPISATVVSPTATATQAPSETPTGTPTVEPTPAPLKHVVVAGENLAIIARKYGVSVAALMAANNIKDGDVIRVGQELIIPVGVTPSPTAPKTTETPAATAQATLAPTLTVTATAGAAGAPTATFAFAAPSLLTPPNNAIIKGAEDILLNWTSVGLLDDNTWYVVSIRREDQSEPSLGWTRTTAWRFPASEFPGAEAASNRFYWSVTVMRAVEGSAPEALSPQSEERVFVWE